MPSKPTTIPFGIAIALRFKVIHPAFRASKSHYCKTMPVGAKSESKKELEFASKWCERILNQLQPTA